MLEGRQRVYINTYRGTINKKPHLHRMKEEPIIHHIGSLSEAHSLGFGWNYRLRVLGPKLTLLLFKPLTAPGHYSPV